MSALELIISFRMSRRSRSATNPSAIPTGASVASTLSAVSRVRIETTCEAGIPRTNPRNLIVTIVSGLGAPRMRQFVAVQPFSDHADGVAPEADSRGKKAIDPRAPARYSVIFVNSGVDRRH